MIEEVITVADNGGDIYKINYENPYECNKSEMTKIAESCTESFLHENFKAIFSYFHNTLADVLPVDILKKVWENTTSVCGKFIKIEKYQLENNVIAHYLRYENIGIIIKYVFNDGQITGIWLDYYE